jgi:hypothetical protein
MMLRLALGLALTLGGAPAAAQGLPSSIFVRCMTDQ